MGSNSVFCILCLFVTTCVIFSLTLSYGARYLFHIPSASNSRRGIVWSSDDLYTHVWVWQTITARYYVVFGQYRNVAILTRRYPPSQLMMYHLNETNGNGYDTTLRGCITTLPSTLTSKSTSTSTKPSNCVYRFTYTPGTWTERVGTLLIESQAGLSTRLGAHTMYRPIWFLNHDNDGIVVRLDRKEGVYFSTPTSPGVWLHGFDSISNYSWERI